MGRARYLSSVVASLSGLHLVLIFAFGLMLISTDWRALECFDGTEPACDEPVRDTGLSAVTAGGWLLGALGVTATLSAIVLALRVRRPAQVVPVLLLCVVSVGIGQILWSRL